MKKYDDIVKVEDRAFWSRRIMLAAAGDQAFFDEAGQNTIADNIPSAGAFSTVQFFVAREIYFSFMNTDSTPFSVAQLALVNIAINTLRFDLNKNQSLVWQGTGMTVFTAATAAVTSGWDSVNESIKGCYKLNKAIDFAPGETFRFTSNQQGTTDLSSILLDIQLRGFFGVSEKYETEKMGRA